MEKLGDLTEQDQLTAVILTEEVVVVVEVVDVAIAVVEVVMAAIGVARCSSSSGGGDSIGSS